MTMKKSVQNSPYIIKGEKKKYAWCACGDSSNQPFCDGSHMKSEKFSPVIFENEKEGISHYVVVNKLGILHSVMGRIPVYK